MRPFAQRQGISLSLGHQCTDTVETKFKLIDISQTRISINSNDGDSVRNEATLQRFRPVGGSPELSMRASQGSEVTLQYFCLCARYMWLLVCSSS